MFSYNLELALSGLRRFPKSTLLAIITVALGLSASMTTLTLLHVLSADPLPGLSQGLYLGWVDTVQAKTYTFDPLDGVKSLNYKRIKKPDAEALLSAHRAVRQTAVADMAADIATADGRHVQKDQLVLTATSDFVPMFGVALRYGRAWDASEDASHARVVLIDTDLAQKLFGTGNAVGRDIWLNKAVFRVVGVYAPYAPQPHFFDLDSGAFSGDGGENVILPYTAALDGGLKPRNADGCDEAIHATSLFNADAGHCSWLSYWVQLNTPEQVAAYRDYLMHYAERQKALAGYAKPAQAQLVGVASWLAMQNVVPDSVRLNAWLAGSFLLLCMINVAGLLAAKFLRRSGEIGIRRALGAPRRAVFAQHVLEAGLVSVLGGVLALPLTLFGLWTLRLQDQGFTDLARLDPVMFGGLFALALAVGIVTGLMPAWRASTVEPGLQVKSA